MSCTLAAGVMIIERKVTSGKVPTTLSLVSLVVSATTTSSPSDLRSDLSPSVSLAGLGTPTASSEPLFCCLDSAATIALTSSGVSSRGTSRLATPEPLSVCAATAGSVPAGFLASGLVTSVLPILPAGFFALVLSSLICDINACTLSWIKARKKPSTQSGGASADTCPYFVFVTGAQSRAPKSCWCGRAPTADKLANRFYASAPTADRQ